jgi:hypothetical protein
VICELRLQPGARIDKALVQPNHEPIVRLQNVTERGSLSSSKPHNEGVFSMKNFLALVLGMSIIASPAFASRARLESLGESKLGSYYIQDSRNIFLNPAQIVHYKKKLWLELGAEQVGAADAASTYGQTTPATNANGFINRPQGGFTSNFGDFTYGLYMNQTSDRAILGIQQANGAVALLAPAFGNNYFLAPDSQLEAFIGGEAGLNWGFSAFYAGNDDKNATTFLGRTSKLVGVRLGVELASNLQLFSTVGITSSSKVNNATQDEVKGKVSVDLGATYGMNDMTLFAKFMNWGSDILFAGQTTEARNLQFGVGAGWKHEMSKTVTSFARLEGDYSNLRAGGSTNRSWNIPAVVGAEAAALSWLTIRGSVAQSIVGQSNIFGARTSFGGTTTVAAGLGVTVGDVVIDGLVATDGSNNPNANSQSGSGLGTAPQTNTGFGFGNGMLTRVGMTYNF